MGLAVKKWRVVLVGCGAVSGAWLRAAADLPEVELVGLVDLEPSRARQRAEEFGLRHARIDARLEDALAALKPDVIFDCTIPSARREVAERALAAGCHVFSEKPLAETMTDARAIVAAARAARRIHAVMQNRRCLPGIARLRRWVESGTFGRVNQVDVDFFLGARFGGFRDRTPHVLLVDMAIHHLDLIRYLTGADPVRLWCHEWNPPGSWYLRDAAAVIAGEMTGDIVFTYRGSWCAEGLNTSWEGRWRVQGERGAAFWDGEDELKGEVAVESSGFRSQVETVEPPQHFDAWRTGGHAGMIRHFFHCLEEGREPETVCHENLKSLAMVMAAVRSSLERREIAIAEILEG